MVWRQPQGVQCPLPSFSCRIKRRPLWRLSFIPGFVGYRPIGGQGPGRGPFPTANPKSQHQMSHFTHAHHKFPCCASPSTSTDANLKSNPKKTNKPRAFLCTAQKSVLPHIPKPGFRVKHPALGGPHHQHRRPEVHVHVHHVYPSQEPPPLRPQNFQAPPSTATSNKKGECFLFSLRFIEIQPS